MDAKTIRRYVIFCAIVIMVFLMGISIAADRCSEKKVLNLETILAELDCSEQDRAVIKEVLSDKISECDSAMIAGICKPGTAEQGLTEENSLRLELNNTTIKEQQ